MNAISYNKYLSRRCALVKVKQIESGDYGMKVTPVPIPNTKVKLQCADGTAGVALWESRSLPGRCGSLAQLVRATGS